MSEEQEAMRASARYGWRMPPLEPWSGVVATLEEAGFERIRARDFSFDAMPATKRLRERWSKNAEGFHALSADERNRQIYPARRDSIVELRLNHHL